MASQLGRLLGVMILTIELSRIGVKRWELLFVCGTAFVGLGVSLSLAIIFLWVINFCPVFVFATNATNNGTTRYVLSVYLYFRVLKSSRHTNSLAQSAGEAFCYRQRYVWPNRPVCSYRLTRLQLSTHHPHLVHHSFDVGTVRHCSFGYPVEQPPSLVERPLGQGCDYRQGV